MKLIIKYYMTDGIDLLTPLTEELTFTCYVQSFSDYIDILGKHIMTTQPEELYATIKSVKVYDFNDDSENVAK